jgi:two-component system cell cycle sensor histidine kinase/response regulator CckA
MPSPMGYEDVIAGFLQQISEADARAMALRATNGGSNNPNPIFQELDVALEELHTAEEELRAQNEELIAAKEQIDAERQRYFELFKDAPVAYLVSDMNGVIQDANRAACDLLHRPERFLRGKPIAIFAPETERGAIRDVIHDLNHLESARQRLEIILSPSGTRPFTAELIASRVPARGPASTIRWTMVDRPQNDQDRDAAVAERAVARTLEQSNEEVIITIDRDHRVTWWNHAAELAFGYSAQEVVGKSSPVGLPEHFDGVGVFERKDGRKIKLDVSCLLLPPTAADGYMFRMRRVRTDRRRQPEAAGQRMVTRLAGGMAHHLNNVMQIVVSGLEFARRDVSNQDQLTTDLQTVRDAAFRAVAFTRALVSYTGQDPVGPKTAVDLNKLVESVVRDASLEAPDTVQFSTFLDRRIPEIRVDSEALGRVIGELLQNAARSVASGGRVLVETRNLPSGSGDLRGESDRHTDYVRLSVHDDGVGISEENRGHLFEPFFTARPVGNPMGLGLSAAWGIVMRCGGFIRVESKHGSGSSFHVFLPVSPSDRLASLEPEAQV